MDIKIYNKTVNEDIIANIIKKIKEKKELANVDEILCYDYITKFLTVNTKILKFLDSADDFKKISKSKEVKAIIKQVRTDIRKVYGLFIIKDLAKADKILDELKEELKTKKLSETLDLHDKLMKLHTSTEERIDIYPTFYKKIFDITGRPKSIFEIASGFNPFSFPYMNLDKVEYTATELNNDDVKLIKKYFKIAKIKGKASKLDITKTVVEAKADIAIILKLFDLTDPKINEKVIKDLDVKWIVVSFPTTTVTKAQMRVKRRAGFQKMLRRLKLEYKTIEFENEIVYIIKK